MVRSPGAVQPVRLGRYELLGEIGAGGMATVHLGRAVGPAGFERLVAVKVCHPNLREDEELVRMFLDEARLAARIHHPNVVSTIDVGDEESLYLVMEYIEGGSLAQLLAAVGPLPVGVCLRIVGDVLSGLHAAHETAGSDGRPLGLVHRDVSPQNVLVGVDGVARLSDFGIARAEARLAVTRQGVFKGKLAYAAPELYPGHVVTRRSDVFAASVVLWEALTGRSLFGAPTQAEVLHALLFRVVPPPSEVRPDLPAALDALVLRGLARDPAERWATAGELADALEATGLAAGRRDVEALVGRALAETLSERRRLLHEGGRAEQVEAPSGEAEAPRTGAPTGREGPAGSLARAESGPVADRILLRYELREVLGRGGMGVVYAAWDRVLERDVALKVMRRDVSASERYRERFLREGRTAAALDHPNVVRIHDVDPAACTLILERIRGESLALRLRRKGRLPRGEALRTLREILAGLAAAHRVGIVHRDLKPSNVLITDEGVAKISDFGVAFVSASDLTDPGELLGTPEYMPPERAAGGPSSDPRSDLWAVGRILAEMLAGRAPPGDDARARVLEATGDAALAELCARCLAADPAARYASAEELAAALDAAEPGGTPAGRVSGVFLDLPLPVAGERDDVRHAALRLYAVDATNAQAALTAIVTAEPDCAAAHYYLALARGFGLFPRADAQRAIDAARALPQPESRRAALDAMALFLDEAWPAALARLAAPVAAAPEDWELLYALGEIQTHGGDPLAGYASFERASRLAPHFLLPHLHAVDTAFARADRPALDRWREVLERFEAKPDAGPAVAIWLAIWEGDPRATAIAPDAEGPFCSMARLIALGLAGDLDGARALAAARTRQYWWGDPDTPDATSLAWISFLQGRTDEWERWMAMARELSAAARPDSAAWTFGEQALAYAMAGRHPEAARAAATARERAGALHSRIVGFAEAFVALAAGTAPPPAPASAVSPVDALFQQAVAEAAGGQPERAVELLDRALAEATDTRLLVPIAWCLERRARGRDEDARRRAVATILRPRRAWSTWAYARATLPTA